MEQLIEELTRDDLNVIPVPRDGKAILSAIEHYQPELTLCELFLPGYDAISILNQLKEQDNYSTIKDVLVPQDYNMIVTPKEIDELIENMKDVVARGINMSL